MFFKNSGAFLTVLKCEVEISWTFLGVFYAVVGPLGSNWEGAAVSKEFLLQLIGGSALVGGKEDGQHLCKRKLSTALWGSLEKTWPRKLYFNSHNSFFVLISLISCSLLI